MSDIDGDTQITLEPPAYPDSQPLDEQRRAFVLECLTQCGDAPSIDGRIFVNNCDLVYAWLESRAVPEIEKQKRLQAVKA